MFQSIHAPNQTTCKTRNGVDDAASFNHSATTSMAVRVAARCVLIAPKARFATSRGRLRSDRSSGVDPRGVLPDAAAPKFFTSASIAAARGENRASPLGEWDSAIGPKSIGGKWEGKRKREKPLSCLPYSLLPIPYSLWFIDIHRVTDDPAKYRARSGTDQAALPS